MSAVEEKRFFSKFDAKGRNNKFWNITLYANGDVEVHFGPQGKTGQTKTFTSGPKSGRAGFEKQIEGKLAARKGYTENAVVETVISGGGSATQVAKSDLRQQAVSDIAGACPALTKLIAYFAEVNAHNITQASGGKITYDSTDGLFRTTQGVVTLDQIQTARALLDDISACADHNDFDSDDFFASVNPYLSLIPQEGLVRKLDFADMFGLGASGGLRKQNDVLDGLESSHATVLARPKTKGGKKKTTKKAPLFKVDLKEVEEKKIDRIRKFYRDSKGGHRDVSHYDVRRVFKLKIHTMHAAYQKMGASMSNVLELWHGTKASNMLSILKAGMIIPSSSAGHVTGRMFGDGLYFSDQSTKAIRYATGAWSGGGQTDRKFMFLVKVAMGKAYVPNTWSWSFKPPRDYDSCFAKAGKSGVQNNEMIVYNVGQANPIYLIEFTPGGR